MRVLEEDEEYEEAVDSRGATKLLRGASFLHIKQAKGRVLSSRPNSGSSYLRICCEVRVPRRAEKREKRCQRDSCQLMAGLFIVGFSALLVERGKILCVFAVCMNGSGRGQKLCLHPINLIRLCWWFSLA